MMELMNFFVNVKEDSVELFGFIQMFEFLSKFVVSILGIDEEKIVIGMICMGGGFGCCLYGYFGVEVVVIF